MKNTQQNFLYMCRKVKKFYRLHEEVIDNNKNLANLFINLSSLVDRLQIEFDKSISYSNGFSIERARKREELQNNILMITEALIKLRDSLKYKPIEQLSAFIDLDFVEMSVMNEEDILDYSSNLYDLLMTCEARLKIQGLRQKKIDSFISSLTLFALDYPMNKYSIEMRKQASLQSLKAYTELTQFFMDKMDPAMSALETTFPNIYADYQIARTIVPFEVNNKADFEGVLNDGNVHIIVTLKYDRDREYRVSVNGGNAIWGLSNKIEKIEHCRPINSREKINLLSRHIGDNGDNLMIQAVNATQAIEYKVWIIES